MSLRKVREREELISNKQGAWGGLLFGVLLLLIGIYLLFKNSELHPFLTHSGSRYSSQVTTIKATPTSSAIMSLVFSLLLFILSYGSFRKLKSKRKVG